MSAFAYFKISFLCAFVRLGGNDISSVTFLATTVPLNNALELLAALLFHTFSLDILNPSALGLGMVSMLFVDHPNFSIAMLLSSPLKMGIKKTPTKMDRCLFLKLNFVLHKRFNNSIEDFQNPIILNLAYHVDNSFFVVHTQPLTFLLSVVRSSVQSALQGRAALDSY